MSATPLRTPPSFGTRLSLLASAVVVGSSIAVVAVAAPAAAAVADPASVVNTLLGTTNGGNTFPGADVPFGMVQWSPDTNCRPQGGG